MLSYKSELAYIAFRQMVWRRSRPARRGCRRPEVTDEYRGICWHRHAAAGGRRCGATGRQGHSNDTDQPRPGVAFAEIINATDPTLSIEPRNTKGSNEN